MKVAMVAIRHQQSASGNSFMRLYSTRAGALDPKATKVEVLTIGPTLGGRHFSLR
jgi:hypothetical protein